MMDANLKPNDAAGSSAGGHRAVLGLLVAGQLMFAAICSPAGIRSGQWAAPWLPYPDFLVLLAAGAIGVHPLVLYPLWAGLRAGKLLRRFAGALLFSSATFGVNSVWAALRSFPGPRPAQLMFLMACVSLLVLGFAVIGQIGKVQIGSLGDPPSRHRICAHPVQFRLRHLFVSMAIIALILAAYRLRFPHGLPIDVIAEWRRQAARTAFVVLVSLPTALIALMVLAVRCGIGAFILYTAGLVCWAGVDCGLIRFGSALRPITWLEMTSIQLGSSIATLISALALRAAGYRLFRLNEGVKHPV